MKKLFFFLPVLLSACLNAQSLGGQHGGAKYAANRGDLEVGLGGSYLRPDYGQGTGVMLNPYAALDFRRSYLGVEVDGNITIHDKAAAHPNSVLAGLRIGADFGPARLYVKPAIGYGHFSGDTRFPSGSGQNYFVYDFGGGVDYQFLDHVNLRAFASYQIWPGFNGNTTAAYDHGGVLNPIYAGIGGAYRF